MSSSVLQRVPMVGGVAYRERLRTLPASFTATLAVEPDNRYFMHAIAVVVDGGKIGYVAPEVAAGYYDSVQASPTPVTCPGRRSSRADHETSGVEAILDFSGLPLAAAQ